MGSQYLVTDAGMAPGRAVVPSQLRRELALLRFSFSSDAPNRMDLYIPVAGVDVRPADGEGLEALLEASAPSSAPFLCMPLLKIDSLTRCAEEGSGLIASVGTTQHSPQVRKELGYLAACIGSSSASSYL